MESNKINFSRTLSHSEIEGPGTRFVLWTQGCVINCKGCCNQSMIPLINKNIVLVKELFAKILEAKNEFKIEGITVFGGEPFIQPRAMEELFDLCQKNNLTVIAFSGFYYEDLLRKYPNVIKNLDVLVDGPFMIDKLDKKRRLVGSTNQRVFYLTDKYKNSEYFEANEIEVEIDLDIQDSNVLINGDGAHIFKDNYKK
ncbi:4Fe-4S single cluster domain-containing protein [Spiroplasma endosymbiont of Amphibalanus improvisus]|uniref:4Fe-4S single cluster domain-containing protein n=1 Tax=Spiroplasma endosymbiont of Amphibalanus improvisus TaxID=3066327 RepID=UPI00313E7F5D